MKRARSCLSYWFPLVRDAGLPVPKTVIVEAPDLSPWLSLKRGQSLTAGFDGFFSDLVRASDEVGGFPIFLRTGLGSGKHEWQNTCFVPNLAALPDHAYSIFEWSEIVDLPIKDWRERLAEMNVETPEEVAELTVLSRRAAAAVPGFWSVDWLMTKDRGWVLIDMAEGENSFHWQGCPSGPIPCRHKRTFHASGCECRGTNLVNVGHDCKNGCMEGSSE